MKINVISKVIGVSLLLCSASFLVSCDDAAINSSIGTSTNVDSIEADSSRYGYYPTDNSNYIIRTPTGYPVNAKYRINELSTSEKIAKANEISAQFPQARIVREASRRYNCHSYAWYSQSAYNPIWLGNDYEVTKYFQGGYVSSVGIYYMPSYELIAIANSNHIPAHIPNGAKAIYRTQNGGILHSAIVFNTASNELISKWGESGLYVHKPSECPYVGSYIEYYRLK
jgi:hypothetical protein